MYFPRSSEIGEVSPFPPQLVPFLVVVGSTAWGAALGAIVSRKGDRGRGALLGASVNGGTALALVLVKAVAG